MNKPKLILSNSIPFNIPLRFFFTAPIVGIAVAAFMFWLDPDDIANRWSKSVLAITHIMVLGYIGMVMQGALFQIISVLLGAKQANIKRISTIIHMMLIVGTLLLAIGFQISDTDFIRLAILVLATLFILFFVTVISAILNAPARPDACGRIRLVLLSLMITTIIGFSLAAGYGWDTIIINRHLTDIHLAWGILGWICLLVITIAYEVVPMFQLTPAYPAILQRWLSLSIFSGLLTLSAGKLSGLDFITLTGSILLGISLGVFAIITVWLQSKRKKKQFNITVWFWFFAMLCLLTAIVLWLSAQFIHELNNNPTYPLILGSLMIFGFSVSVINGMLYKIIPFLSWVHLSITVTQLNVSRRQIPNIKSFIQHQPTFIQFGLHLSSVLLIIACIIKPTIFISLAALSFALSNALLWWNLYSGYRIYKKAEMEIIFAEKNRINN